MHRAIDLAYEMYGIDFIMPKKAIKRNKPLFNVHLDEHQNVVYREKKLNWINNDLNEHQRQAVVNVLRADLLNPYVIHGPPGTGKTTTLVEIVLQILANIRNSKIIIVTQSNSAADLIAERLIESKCLDSESLLRFVALSYARAPKNRSEVLKGYCKTKQDFQLDTGSEKTLEGLKQAKKYRVIVSTSAAIAKFLDINFFRNHFTHAVIDEAGQSTEVGVLIPMCLIGPMGQTIMAGDPMQMPPLVVNQYANERGLSVSMLSRLLKCYSNFKSLNYRALPSILNYYSKQFYNNELVAMISAEGSRDAKLLQHLCKVFGDKHPTDYGIHFIDIDYGRCEKRKNSWFNICESKVVKYYTKKLLELGLDEGDIGIITPYALQVRAIEFGLKEMPRIRIGTVEDFQGQERKVVLLSAVRTCPGGAQIDLIRKLGFVKCPQRINVAMSRACVMIVVFGKAKLLSADENWKAVIEGCKMHGTYINFKSDDPEVSCCEHK